jgi:hypothetical protein
MLGHHFSLRLDIVGLAQRPKWPRWPSRPVRRGAPSTWWRGSRWLTGGREAARFSVEHRWRGVGALDKVEVGGKQNLLTSIIFIDLHTCRKIYEDKILFWE